MRQGVCLLLTGILALSLIAAAEPLQTTPLVVVGDVMVASSVDGGDSGGSEKEDEPARDWTPSDFGTIAIALVSLASFVASGLFYRWTWMQRNPRPIIVDTAFNRPNCEVGHRIATLTIHFANPGDIPIYPVLLQTRVEGWPSPAAKKTKVYTGRDRILIAPRTSHDLEKDLNSAYQLKQAFPVGILRNVTVVLRYSSGGKLRKRRYRRVALIKRLDGGLWSHWPLLVRKAYRREFERDQTQRTTRRPTQTR